MQVKDFTNLNFINLIYFILLYNYFSGKGVGNLTVIYNYRFLNYMTALLYTYTC